LPSATRKSRASFRWILSSTAISLAASPSLCFAQENQNISQESAASLAAIIAAVSAAAAVIAAVVASRSALAAVKSADAAMLGAQKKYDGTLPPPITITVNKRIDWARNFIGAIDTPFGTVLTILFSIAVGLGLSLLLSQSAPPSARVPASKPATPASTGFLSAPPTAAAAAPASTARVSVSPPPTSIAAAPASPVSVSTSPPPTFAASDHHEIANLLARGHAFLSDGDVALARVFLRRAAERDDPQAALALGGTYDPVELRGLGVPNFQAQADPAKAREWYRRAAELGSAAAALRLERLP
jgi:TPR repeat protein